MTRNAVAASLLLLGLVLAAPSQAAVIEGTIESVSGNTATIRSDDGGVFTVDLSGMAAERRRSAAPGRRVTVEGNYTRDVTFAASRVATGIHRHVPSATIHGTVRSVHGTTLMVQSYDGGVFTVDASQVASLPALRPGDEVTLTGNYPGSVTIAAQDIRQAPGAQDSAQAARQEWQSVHGRVESVQGNALTFKADDGRTLSVDMSRVSPRVQRALTPGEGVTVIGFAGSSGNLFTARYVQQDSDRSRAGRD